jgi:hypothetical protein
MFPTQITLRNLRHSTELNTHIRELSEKLSLLHPLIQRCRVEIEQPIGRTRRARQTPQPFSVEVQVRLPGCEIVAHPPQEAALDAALHKAFALARRQLRQANLSAVSSSHDAHGGISSAVSCR